jgi:hypothetical protein
VDKMEGDGRLSCMEMWIGWGRKVTKLEGDWLKLK